MQAQQRSSPPPPSTDLAFVPFSWEEKPGVPKSQESNPTLLFSIHIPRPPAAALHPALLNPPCPLSKPPRLQPHYGTPTLRETPSFGTIHSSPPPPRHHSGLLVRKQSFDSVIYSADGCRTRPLTRKYSHGSLPTSQQKRSLQGRKEDDPFFMAIQACRKEPIRVFYHGDRSPARESKSRARCGNGELQRMEEEGMKHLTIRQLFTQQLQEEERLHMRAAQKQPLIVKKKQASGPFTFLARCLGCY